MFPLGDYTFRKSTFYTLTRGERGLIPLRKEGFSIIGFPFDAFVYKTVFKNGVRKWYLVEGRSGLSISEGNTKKEAVEVAEEHVQKYGVEAILEISRKSTEKYGVMPGYRPTYL